MTSLQRYPGARVDNASRDYSFKFSKELYDEWDWYEVYAPQKELMTYVNHLVERFQISDVIQFKSRVVSATWDDQAKKWDVEIEKTEEDGEKGLEKWTGQFVVAATGCLSSPNVSLGRACGRARLKKF